MNDQRQRVLDEAMEWLGTPFHDCSAVKGAGVDCAHFVHAGYVAAGVIGDQHIQPYSPQHMMHRDEELFLGYVLATGAREIALAEAQPADLIIYRIGRVYAHGALAIAWPDRIIHAHMQSGRVLISSAFECDLRGRQARAFSFW